MDQHKSNRRELLCLIVGAVVGLIFSGYIIMREPPEQRLAVFWTIVAFGAVFATAIWLLKVSEKRCNGKR